MNEPRTAAECRLPFGRIQPSERDSGVALLAAIFFMVLAAGLSIALLSALLSQAVPARTAAKNTRTVYSAQAGLQTALGLIRSATAAPDPVTGQVYGAPGKLPCAISGRVGADTLGAYYSVTIDYFTTDPTNTTDAWRASNHLACSAAGVPSIPTYAYVYSGGKDAVAPTSPADGDRALSAVYKFKVSNVNVTGGPIYNSNHAYCLEAVTATAGSEIKFVTGTPCPNNPLDLWTYSTDYQLELASTTAGGLPGLCITGGPTSSGDTTTRKATLQACRTSTDANRWNQLWSWTGDYSWRGELNPVSAGPSNFCLSPDQTDGTSLAGRFLYVRNGCNGTFSPASSVGAGAAGYSTHQLVNYQEFGRCADVTNEVITSSFMISYPCKQDPTGTGTYLKWNHKWYYSEPTPPVAPAVPTPANATLGPQLVYVYDSTGVKRCLTTPTDSSRYVTFGSCTGAVAQNWTRVNDTGDYASSYLMIDNTGRCLVADSTDLFNTFYSKIAVARCDGSLAQKWNAPAIYVDSTVGSYREIAR